MSAHRLVTIFCDGPNCGVWHDPLGVADTATQARTQLRGTGWRTGVPAAYARPGESLGKGSRDYCPKHAAEVQR